MSRPHRLVQGRALERGAEAHHEGTSGASARGESRQEVGWLRRALGLLHHGLWVLGYEDTRPGHRLRQDGYSPLSEAWLREAELRAVADGDSQIAPARLRQATASFAGVGAVMARRGPLAATTPHPP